jgi:dienelactone hydrolase
LAALAVVAALGGLLAVLIGGGGTTPWARTAGHASSPTSGGIAGVTATVTATVSTPVAPTRPSAPFAVGLTVLRFVDNTRSVRLPDGAVVPRALETYVLYPASGPAAAGYRRRAQPARTAGPFPLVVFGHGFAVTPTLYIHLLEAWARAGFVVAAPVFPLGNANAPGGPNESDLPNQPADMSFVISSMLSASRAPARLLSGLVAPRRIAVAGQSDGGDTALAVAYDPRFRDSRVGAAVILSGAEIPFLSGFQIQPGGPPLLATQGTADTINLPSATSAFYDSAPAPKYLLEVLGAAHLPPYSTQQPQLGVVERVTIAFLRHYLEHVPGSLSRMTKAGNVPGVATLDADP